MPVRSSILWNKIESVYRAKSRSELKGLTVGHKGDDG